MEFTVEIKAAGEIAGGGSEVELFLDAEAMADLVQQLAYLKQPGDHAHFMTPSWGGNSLTEDGQREGNVLVHHLRITLVA